MVPPTLIDGIRRLLDLIGAAANSDSYFLRVGSFLIELRLEDFSMIFSLVIEEVDFPLSTDSAVSFAVWVDYFDS